MNLRVAVAKFHHSSGRTRSHEEEQAELFQIVAGICRTPSVKVKKEHGRRILLCQIPQFRPPFSVDKIDP